MQVLTIGHRVEAWSKFFRSVIRGVLLFAWTRSIALCVTILVCGALFAFVEEPKASNRALLIRVSKDLEGLERDTENISRMLARNSYHFVTEEMSETDASSTVVKDRLQKIAGKVSDEGTLLFYFTGHGTRGHLVFHDREMKIEEIRKTIEASRVGRSPLARLIAIIDACYSGALVGPFGKTFNLIDRFAYTTQIAESYITELSARSVSNSNYWKKLMVLASTAPEEPGISGTDGSPFTLALTEAHDQVAQSKGTIKEWLAETAIKTVGSAPTFRIEPISVESENLSRP